MSKYTTGEVAKLCGVSVRTVQYYDSRKLLVPSELSEGGRRLYSAEDVKRMKIICFLRDLDLPINTIAQLLAEEDPGSVIDLLLQQQAAVLREEIGTRQEKLDKLEELRLELKCVEHFSLESIHDIVYIMENKKKLRNMRFLMVALGLPVTALQWVSIILWITKRASWWFFVLWACLAVVYGVWMSIYYFRRVAYICPKCHAVFRPSFRQMFWANHTPTTRKLTCTQCGHKGFCVEVWHQEQ